MKREIDEAAFHAARAHAEAEVKAMTEPTDAEVEAMAEKLWDVWRSEEMATIDVDYDWPMLNALATTTNYGDVSEDSEECGLHANAFRAMARAALGKLTDENGDEVRG